MGRESDTKCWPRVAIHMGSGKIVQREATAADVFEPLDIDTAYRIHAYMDVDVRSDEEVWSPDGGSEGPIRVTASVRSRGANWVDSVIQLGRPPGDAA